MHLHLLHQLAMAETRGEQHKPAVNVAARRAAGEHLHGIMPCVN